MSGTSAATFVLAGIWIILLIVFQVAVRPVIIDSADGDPEGEAFDRVWLDAVVWVMLFVAGVNLVAGVGIHMEQPWGSAVAYGAIPINLMTVIGSPWAIAHMAVLPRR